MVKTQLFAICKIWHDLYVVTEKCMSIFYTSLVIHTDRI